MPSIFPVNHKLASHTWCNSQQYLDMYQQSIQDPDTFWAEQAQRLDWMETWHTVKNCSFHPSIRIRAMAANGIVMVIIGSLGA